ncbi:MAG: acyl-ACP thioesterase domain-containing protein, partial [Ilumatobacteraceae bacterium]
MFEMVGTPNGGRTFAGERRVRLGDCSPGGRLRLDASARFLQDLSDDDTRDAGFAQMTWVVRRTVIDVLRFPVYLEAVDMLTWCSGMGSRWAERRVDIA